MTAPPPWEALKDVDVPVGARGRVRQRVVDALAAPRPRRRRAPVLLAGLALAGAAAAGIVVVARDGAPPPARPVAVADGQRVALAVGQGHASVVGPAEVRVVDGALRIRQGVVETLGAMAIAGPQCEAHVDGSAQVSVRGDATQVRVFAGFARVAHVDPLCEVIDLTDAPGPAPAAAPAASTAPIGARDPIDPTPIDAGVPDAETIVAAAPPRAVAPRPRSAAPPLAIAPPPPLDVDDPAAADDAVAAAPAADPPAADPPAADPPAAAPATDPLTAEVAAYRAAVAREAADPVTAIAAWRAVIDRWPDGALAEAAELRLIALLGRLGRRAPQEAAARAFLARHPRSARAADVARLLEAP
ncbi:MAG: hypothetical protein IPH44_15710 [Myxococcales bacterium]|nr:hypothetical protein [Myxococcales bacterium]